MSDRLLVLQKYPNAKCYKSRYSRLYQIVESGWALSRIMKSEAEAWTDAAIHLGLKEAAF